MQRVNLIGLDFGTTTCSAVSAAAAVRANSVSARMELSDVQERFRSDMVLTPFAGGRLDLPRIEAHVDSWLTAAKLGTEPIFGGGALLTGLAAQASNAAELIALVRGRLKDAVIARADDPSLESWLAFMGNCAGLSAAHPQQPILNLDVGGGTTNLALGLAGQVLATGCLFVGARHFQVVPGTYRITSLSRYAEALLRHLGLDRRIGDDLSQADLDAILSYYLGLLQAAASADVERMRLDIDQLHVQVPLTFPMEAASPQRPQGTPCGLVKNITLSGGVGELVYRHLRGEPWPGTTAFGDLGIDLAERLAAAPFWASHWRRHQPEAGGRATVLGLLRHSTHVSGSTVFLPHPEDLPLRDLPILGTLTVRSSDAVIAELIRLASGCGAGAALRVMLEDAAGEAVKLLAARLSEALRCQPFPPHVPLVLLVEENLGKVLGQYVTAWGSQPWHVAVIDEIVCRNAQYAHVGAMCQQVIPVSFFGLR